MKEELGFKGGRSDQDSESCPRSDLRVSGEVVLVTEGDRSVFVLVPPTVRAADEEEEEEIEEDEEMQEPEVIERGKREDEEAEEDA